MKRLGKFWTYAAMSGSVTLIIFTLWRYSTEISKGSATNVSKPLVNSEITEAASQSPETSFTDQDARASDPSKSAYSRLDQQPEYIVHPIVEDLKRFPESYVEAIEAADYGYAGDLLDGKACVNATKDPVADPDCLPLLRSEIAKEERLFVSDRLASSYLEMEPNPELKNRALRAIKRINPDVYDERGPCLEYDVADTFEGKDDIITSCLQKLNEQIEELGIAPLKNYFWKHVEYLSIRSRKDANRFKTDMEEKFPGISSVPQGPAHP